MSNKYLIADMVRVASELTTLAIKLVTIAEALDKEYERVPVIQPVSFKDAPAYLTTKEAAAMLSMTEGALGAWRARGGGPPYKRIGRIIRYPLQGLVDWGKNPEEGNSPKPIRSNPLRGR